MTKFLTTLLGLLAALAVAACSGGSPASVPSPGPYATALASSSIGPFLDMAAAVNRGDVDAAVAVFTEDVVWERGGQCPPRSCTGTPAVQRELTRDVMAHHQLTVVGADTSEANNPTVRVELRNDGTRRANTDRVIQFFALQLTAGKISAVRVTFDTSDAVTAAFVASQAGSQR